MAFAGSTQRNNDNPLTASVEKQTTKKLLSLGWPNEPLGFECSKEQAGAMYDPKKKC